MKIRQHNSHNNDSAKRRVFSLVKKRVYVDEVRMCDGRRFQADGAATEKELLEKFVRSFIVISDQGALQHA